MYENISNVYGELLVTRLMRCVCHSVFLVVRAVNN